MYILSIALAVLGSLCYHVSSRAVDRRLPVSIALAVAYATAFFIVLASGLIIERRAFSTEIVRYIRWPAFGLAAGIVLIEAGFILAYRAGWKISGASLVANVISSVLLVVIGRTLLDERLSPTAWSGVVLAVVALVLMNANR